MSASPGRDRAPVNKAMVTSLTSMFRSEPDDSRDGDDKLHDLYWNRAELKKEFAALRNEKYTLQDRIKEAQGATARVQQKMDHLESLLLDREWVHNVVVFYQFRRLAAHCHSRLQRFAEELKQKREKRVHGKVLVAWNEKRNLVAAGIERRIDERRVQNRQLEDRLQSERHRLTTMGGIRRMLSGQSLESEIDELTSQVEQGRKAEQRLLVELDETRKMRPPDHEGLDVETKRSINFMILSFLQQLYLHFADDNLAELARESSEKSVGAINYGSKRECDELIARLDRRWDSADKLGDSPKVLRRRAALIAEQAMFRSDDDVVPLAGTVATVYRFDANGRVVQKDVNLLGENYFGVSKVLSR